MQLAVGLWGTELQRGIIITLPLGVILPPGIRMEIDGENIGSAPFYRCAPNGCQARIPLQEELLNRLKAGSAGNIYFREVNGQDVPIPFSLSGFTAGFASVR